MNNYENNRKVCAFCQSDSMVLIHDFGEMALAGGFLKETDFETEIRYPMRLYFCNNCAAVQLVDIIEPGKLFENYFYFSSAIGSLREHFSDYATEVVSRFLKPEKSTVVEIGCNDGILLRPIADHHIKTVIGIDPATNVINTINDPRITIYNAFFSKAIASEIELTHGKVDMVVANNVYAHIPDINGVTEAIHHLLKDDGVFIFETHYLGNIINGLQYDMVYHEHIYYYSLIALENFFKRFNMTIFDIKPIPIHAGSMRYYVCKNESIHAKMISPRVGILRSKELANGFHKAEVFKRFSADIAKRKQQLMNLLGKLKKKGVRVVGYGASGRANTIIQYCGINSEHMEYMVDDAPAKSGFYTPGSHFLIKPSKYIYEDRPEYLLVFAWGYFAEISEKHRSYFDNGGRAIIPLPDVRINFMPKMDDDF